MKVRRLSQWHREDGSAGIAGTIVRERIYLSPPDVGAAEEDAVAAAVRSGWVAPLGPEVESFERELAAVTGRRHAVALSSGTSALHLGLLNFGVGAGDVVITASLTFAATANAILYTGADPIFVDCDETGNIDVDLLSKAVEDQQASGRRVAAIVAAVPVVVPRLVPVPVVGCRRAVVGRW